MKVLNVSYTRYSYPPGVESLEEFIDFINNDLDRFIKMTKYDEENCSFPYMVKEDIITTYINFSNVDEIFEEDIKVLPRTEYDERLAKVVEQKCMNCENYEDDILNDNLRGHRGKINLDGVCHFYSKKEAE